MKAPNTISDVSDDELDTLFTAIMEVVASNLPEETREAIRPFQNACRSYRHSRGDLSKREAALTAYPSAHDAMQVLRASMPAASPAGDAPSRPLNVPVVAPVEVPAEVVEAPDRSVDKTSDASLATTSFAATVVSGGSFKELCREIRSKVDVLEASIVQQTFEIADRLQAAKDRYEVETSSGHGKRNPSRVTPFVDAAAEEVGRSSAFIQRLLTLSKIDQESRVLIAGADCAPSQATLLAIAREPSISRRAEAIAVLKQGGKAAFDETLRRDPLSQLAKGDPTLLAVLKSLVDPKHMLGGLASDAAVPRDLTEKFAALASYANLGELRAAIRSPSTKPTAPRPKGRPDSKDGGPEQDPNAEVSARSSVSEESRTPPLEERPLNESGGETKDQGARIRAALVAIVGAERQLREDLPSLHLNRLRLVIGELCDDESITDATVDDTASKLTTEDALSGAVLAQLGGLPIDPQADALRREVEAWRSEARRVGITA